MAAPTPAVSPEAVSPDVTQAGEPEGTSRWRLSDMSRRGFLRTGSIGVVAAGVATSVPGLSSLLTSAEADAPELQGGVSAALPATAGNAAAVEGDASGLAQSFSARVSNLSTGEMRLFVGDQTVEIRDLELAQRLSQAARAAQAAGR